MSDDSAVRERALDPGKSFAVRAPAGSGKTSLLIQRILALLPTVEQPEQIVAITFTRKAAEEMRTRIVDALRLAAGPAPTDAFLHRTWVLAHAALAHDAAREWQLAEHPGRLRIMTIDALCQSLVRQMPVTSGMATAPAVEDDQRQLYQEAAREAVAAIGAAHPLRRPIARALRHLDNDWRKLESLLAEMLARRDQWLPMIGAGSDRDVLERGFNHYVADRLIDVQELLPQSLSAKLAALAHYAGSNLDDSPLAVFDELPPATPAAQSAWQAIAGLFLTVKGEWRKRVNKNDGFPAGAGAAQTMKAQWAEICAEMADIAGLRLVLDDARRLPGAPFDDAEWATVSALIALLKTATAHLMVLSDTAGRTDFTAFSLAALNALGDPERPTDLALSLDYQLRHLLIDEFQDTSVTQYELVRRLTAGWSAEDARSLFLVGDPMQSIYRFRQAEVSLFSRILERGRIGSVAIEPLTLSANFRSQARLVDWVNASMPDALLAAGGDAHHFVQQEARHPATLTPVTLHAFGALDPAAEAGAVCRTVQQLQDNDAAASIAILVRSRTHLGQITGALLAAGIDVAAREIKPFVEVPVVADLMALARALLHRADRVAWFAVLRAPWCGLPLSALLRLHALAPTLADALPLASTADGFSADQLARLQRLAVILQRGENALTHSRFSAALEQAWIELGGPALNNEPQAIEDAGVFFAVLSALEHDGVLLSAERLLARLAQRFSEPPAAAAGAVQIMTIHRAKGLEFDHVIIPGCGRVPRGGARPLLHLHKYIDSGGAPNLLLAPIPSKGQGVLFDYLHERDKAAGRAETSRLLYVALTRARRQVCLIGHVDLPPDKPPAPPANTFLALLWESVGRDFLSVLEPPIVAPESAPAPPRIRVARLASLPPLVLPASPAPAASAITPEFEWAGAAAKHVGTVVHRLLQEYAGRPAAADVADDAWVQHAAAAGRGQLLALGVSPQALDAALATLTQALENTLASARGRWLFCAEHREARSELCLASAAGRVVIDRTFVDVDDCRWIIDFKTGTHSGGGLDAWLDAEVDRYRAQLERYAGIMQTLDPRRVRLGLYFPLLDAWREWPYAPTV